MRGKESSKILSLLLALALVVGPMPITAMAASRTTTLTNTQEEDAFTDHYLSEDWAYSKAYRQQPTYMDSSATYYSSWVGADEIIASTYQRSAIKFDISDISGTITSATLTIHVLDVENSPIVNLIKTTDDTWSAQNDKFPSYSPADYINGYSSTPVVNANSDITFTVTDYLQERVDEESSDISFVLTGQEGPDITSYFSFVNMLNDAGCGFIPALSITYDAVNAPTVSSSASITNDATPTWLWSPNSTDPGNGTYCYRIDNDAWSGETMDTAYTPGNNLTDGQHCLYVRESNGMNWSRSGSYSVTVDTAVPVLATGSVDRTSDTEAAIGFTTNEAGTAYYFAVDKGVDAPDKETVAAGTSLGSVSGTVTNKLVILATGAKDIYVVVKDATGNISEPLKIEAAAYAAPPTTVPAITTDSLPSGIVGSDYSQTLEATGGKPITWTIEDGSLPNGLTLNGSTGEISGTPTSSGAFNFTVKAANSTDSVTRGLSIAVGPAPVVNRATISPMDIDYDLSAPGDVVANITWNSASAVTNVVYGTTPLETPDMYVVSASALTIKSSYINTLGISKGDVVTFTISFDKGASSTLTVSFKGLGAATVASADELKAALATTTPINITLTQNIILQDKAEVGADHTLTVPENIRLSTKDQGSIDLGGKTLAVTGGGTLDSQTYNSNLFYNGNLTLENIVINLNNTNDSGVNAGTIDMNSGAIIHFNSKNGSILLAASILNVNNDATLYIEKFGNAALSVENDATLNINGGNVIICPGTDSDGAGIENSGKIRLISGTLSNSRTGGSIHLNPNSTVEGMDGRLMDRGNLLTASGEVTLAAGNTAPSATGLTAGTYLWDGEYFTKPISIEWTGLEAADGGAGTADTTKLTLAFSADPKTLSIDDIEVTGATEESLSGSGLTRTLLISDVSVAEGEKVKVAMKDPVGYTITPATMETAVHRGPTSVQTLETKLKALGFGVTVNGDTVAVSGRKTGATAAISLNIPSGTTVKWGAELTGALEKAALLMIENEGNLEIISGAKLENTASMGITLNTAGKGSLLISGGDLAFKGSRGTVLSVRKGTCVIKGGTVTTADNSNAYQLVIDGVLAVIPSGVELNKIGADNMEGPSAVVRLDSAQSRAMIGSAQGLTVTTYKLKDGNSLTAQWLVRAGVGGINVLNDQNQSYWFVPYSGVEIYVPVAPSIVTNSLPNGIVGSNYNQTLEATGDKPITWSIEDGSLPNGLTLDRSTGVISGTPTASGTFNFVVRAANMISDTQELSIAVETAPVVNRAAITSENHKTVAAGAASTFQVTATGAGTMAYSLSGTVPFGVSIDSSTGLMTIGAIDISGSDSCSYAFTVNAGNGIDPAAAQTFTLTVLAAPVIRLPGFNHGTVGVFYEVQLPVTGATPISWSVVNGALPAGLSLSITGRLSGTPTTAQTSTFSIRAANSVGMDTQQYSIVIQGAGGFSGGGGISGAPTPMAHPEKKPDQPGSAGVTVTAKADKNGLSTVAVSEQSITNTIAKAQAEAKTGDATDNGIRIALNVAMPKGSDSLNLTLTSNSLQSLINTNVQNFEINGAPVSLGLDLKALQEIRKQSPGNISISTTPATGLSKEAKSLIGSRPVYCITISTVQDGKTANVTSLGNGTATLSIPYTPGKNEARGYLFGVYVDDSGKATRINGSAYDANAGAILLPTGHFSVYGVGYIAPSAKFTDIDTHWGKESIDYVVGRGLLSGTTETTFAPDAAMTRGMLVTALGRMASVDTKAYTTDSFTDVKADSPFRPYIEWAYKKGMVQGVESSKFEPDRAITREEIAAIFSNYAKATGYTLPVTRTATNYADDSGIGSTYKTAVTAMQQAGIMMGGSDNRFNPKGNATRAGVSSMLSRYSKLTIDPATAQGWALNDAGQYLYYKDGKALTGTQTIDGVKYFFETDGVLKTGWVKDGENWRVYSGNMMLVGFRDLGTNGDHKTYYFTTDGLMVSGKWFQIDGKWYYFGADGSLAKSTKIDGYEVDVNGVRKMGR